MQFTEIIALAGYAIEAVGVLVVVIGSIISSVVFIQHLDGFPRELPTGTIDAS